MKRAISVFLDLLIVLVGVVSIISTVYAANPGLFDYSLEFLGLDPALIGSVALGGYVITGLGIINKVLKQSSKRDLLKLKAYYEYKQTLLEREFNAKLLNIESNDNKRHALEIEKSSSIIANLEGIRKQNAMIIQGQRVIALRNIKQSDSLVPPEVKSKFKDFLDSTEYKE